MNILIVDDLEDSRIILKKILESGGCTVALATNGEEAMKMAKESLPDIVISDILMPVMDGFTLCHEWRGDERLKEIPFVFYTATYTDPKDEELALSLGADRFIRKPVEPDEFMNIIHGMISDVEKGKIEPKEPLLEKEQEVFKLYSERLIKKLEQKMLDLKREITKRERTEKRVEHLNNVLRAIRGVNQLIIREKNLDSLLKAICEILTETRGYYNVWIVLTGESGESMYFAEADLGENFLPIVNQLKRGKLTVCAQKALKQSEVVVTEDPDSACTDCPLAKLYAGRGALTVRLEYGGKTYGLLSVSVPRDFIGDEEEQSLFKEVAGDVAFALHALESEEKARQAQDDLRQSEQDLRIRNQIANIFLTVPDDEMYGEVLEIVLEAMESKYGVFGYIDEKENWVCSSMTRDVWDQCQVPDKDIIFPREQWGDSIWGRAMVERKALYSNKSFKVPEGHILITRALCVPVIHQREVIGNFLIGNKETDYDEKDRQLLENISDYTAPVLHARLQRDMQERDKKGLEIQLIQAQKMEAIGTLAGGIAHDFNNILSAIMGYSELALIKAPKEKQLYNNVQNILHASHRAKDLVQQILTFSRKTEEKKAPVQISHLVKEALKFLRSSLPTTIEIREEIAREIGIVNANPTQMHQVIMNLCTNASHAMQKEGGILEVGLRNVDLDSHSAARYPDIDPGKYLRLTVSDTGEGIAPEIMGRIFEPYFTTKEKGVGTGMGLSMVHGIVKGHGGMVTVYSEPGKGSTFHVYIPLIQEEGKRPEIDEDASVPTGTEHILFIDDEPALADLGKQMLERLGYEVTSRTSSVEALELFKAQPDRFDLVITDMTMPNMTGDRLAREFVKIRPDIPIIICTGYSEQITEEKAKRMGIKAFVMKPFVMKELAKIVRKTIDGL